MRMMIAIALLAFGCLPAAAFGFSFGGGGREYPYPNEPQYQYPSSSKVRPKCPQGTAPYQGKCRKIRWVQ
ncbi:MAG: hypothetical protein ABW198_00580 [Pseudorhodoplanes sp.]